MGRIRVEVDQPLEKLKASLGARLAVEQDADKRLELHVELNNLQWCANGCTERYATDLDEQGRPVCCVCNMSYRWGDGNRRSYRDRRVKLSNRE